MLNVVVGLLDSLMMLRTMMVGGVAGLLEGLMMRRTMMVGCVWGGGGCVEVYVVLEG